jgi:restriction endonuclease S subunit
VKLVEIAVYEKPNITWVSNKLIEQRIDAQYYKREFINNEIKLRQIKNLTLKELYTKGDYGTLPDSEDYCEKGIYLIRGTDLRDLSIKEDDLILVPEKYFSDKSEVKAGDILILIKGATIDAEWSVSIVPNINYKAIFNGSIFRIRLKKEYDLYFVTVFMSTKYFLNQKKRAISNTGIYYNDKESLENFLIPIPSPEIQKYIGDKVRKAEELREEAKRLKKEVLDRLNTLLFNPNIKIDNNKFLYLDCKEIIDYKIGATIYRPKYVSNRRGLKQGIKLLKLKDISRKIYDGNHGSVHPKNILDEGDIPFIRAQDAHDGLVEINKYISNEEYRLLKHKTINYGDIVYGIKGSVGKGGIYLYENSDATVNPACVVISPKKLVNSGYLIEVLESDYFNNEIYRFAESDSTRPQISRTEFEELEVPMVSEEEQKAIGDLVFRRIKAINQSKQLIQEAKQDVEDLIEGNFDMSKIKANS